MPPEITLKPIDRDNWRAAIELEIRADQRHLLWPNAHSLVEAAYEGYQASGIYHADEMVGLLIYDESGHFVYHLMIDGAHQGKGYGAAAMRLLIERVRGQCDAMHISYEPTNEQARRFYQKLGFVEQGIDPEWGEMRAVLQFE